MYVVIVSYFIALAITDWAIQDSLTGLCPLIYLLLYCTVAMIIIIGVEAYMSRLYHSLEWYTRV